MPDDVLTALETAELGDLRPVVEAALAKHRAAKSEKAQIAKKRKVEAVLESSAEKKGRDDGDGDGDGDGDQEREKGDAVEGEEEEEGEEEGEDEEAAVGDDDEEEEEDAIE